MHMKMILRMRLLRPFAVRRHQVGPEEAVQATEDQGRDRNREEDRPPVLYFEGARVRDRRLLEEAGRVRGHEDYHRPPGGDAHYEPENIFLAAKVHLLAPLSVVS